LHGLEELFGVRYLRTNRYLVVRFADDFLVFCSSRSDAERAVEMLNEWLGIRGLKLSPEKTRITTVQKGFDFLGFTTRVVQTSIKKSGWKVIVTPSKKSVQRIKNRLKEEWHLLKGHNVAAVVKRLNPIIRGQANYYRYQSASRIFTKLDSYVMWKARLWVKHTHPNKPKYWWVERYFGKLYPDSEDRWVFGDKDNNVPIQMYSRFKIRKHIMVTGTNSPDDPKLCDYWHQRTLKQLDENFFGSYRTLAHRQNGMCPICGESLSTDESIEKHHIMARIQGGGEQLDNKLLVHYLCHQQLTAEQRKHGLLRSTQRA
jgi:RNA-directed DNA polymerase